MLSVARKNGIKTSTYYERLKLEWDKEKAATKPTMRRKYEGEYSIYRNDEILISGTAEECAKFMGVSERYIRWMTTPSGKKRAEGRKNPNNATTAVELDD